MGAGNTRSTSELEVSVWRAQKQLLRSWRFEDRSGTATFTRRRIAYCQENDLLVPLLDVKNRLRTLDLLVGVSSP